MKILVFSHEFPPDVGGAGVVAQQNVKSLLQDGCQVTLLTRNSLSHNDFLNKNFKLVSINTSGPLWPFYYGRAIDFNEFDLILLNDIASIYTAGIFFNKPLFEKTICFIHGGEPEIIYEKLSIKRKILQFRMLYNRAILNCTKIIAPSQYMVQKFISRCNLNIVRNKIEVIYAGVDNDLFYPDYDVEFRKSMKIQKSGTIFLSVSRIVAEKGYAEKYEIFKKILLICPNAYWVIVGDGIYLSELKGKAKNDKIHNIIFMGAQPRYMLRKFYSVADVFWLLSKFDESFGLVYLESQMCGTPVIANNRAGVVEAMADNKTGFLVKSESDIIEIVLNKKYKNLKKIDIIDFAKKFETKNLLQKLSNQII